MQFLKLRFQIIIHLKTMLDLEIHMVSQTLRSLRKSRICLPAVTHVPEQTLGSISCKTNFYLPKPLPANLQQTICFLGCFLADLFLKLTDQSSSTTTWNNTFQYRCTTFLTLYSFFNHSGYALMIKEHILCWDKKKYTILYTGQ